METCCIATRNIHVDVPTHADRFPSSTLRIFFMLKTRLICCSIIIVLKMTMNVSSQMSAELKRDFTNSTDRWVFVR